MTAPPSYEQSQGAMLPSSNRNEETVVMEPSTKWIPQPHINGHPPRLQKPVVIPRVDISGMIGVPFPFARVYSESLRTFDIHEQDFVAFIDNLAVAQAAPAPLRVIDGIGTGIGVVPYHWAQFAGLGINVAAGVGIAAVIKTRTKNFMEKVNKDYFGPRGLKATIYKDVDLGLRVGYPQNQPPLVPAPPIGVPQLSVTERRMHALAPYIATLSTNVPPPSQQRNVVDQLTAKSVQARREKQKKKEAKRHQKMQEKAAKHGVNSQSSAYDSDSSDSDSDSSDSEIEAYHRHSEASGSTARPGSKEERKMIKKIAKGEEKLAKKKEKAERKKAKRDSKHHKKSDKMERKSEKSGDKMREKQKKKDDTVQKMGYIVIESL